MQSRLRHLNMKIILVLIAMGAIAGLMLSLGMKNTLDAELYYSQEFFINFFKELSVEQTRMYLRHEILDLGFMAAYTTFFYLGLKMYAGGSAVKLKYWAFAPVVFDAIETVSIILALSDVVSADDFAWLGVMTFLKWLMVIFVLGLLAYGFITHRRPLRAS